MAIKVSWETVKLFPVKINTHKCGSDDAILEIKIIKAKLFGFVYSERAGYAVHCKKCNGFIIKNKWPEDVKTLAENEKALHQPSYKKRMGCVWVILLALFIFMLYIIFLVVKNSNNLTN